MPTIWTAFTPVERRNMAIYIVGIMLYKLGLESFNGSIVTLATDRFPTATTFQKVAMLSGLNQAMQVVGSIAIAPLVKRFPTKSVLSSAIIVFGLITTLFLIIDSATGGKPKSMNGGKVKYGSWNPNALFPLYCISGVAYGMVELIRRIIPRDIVGGDVQKLRKMDAIVHILYEVAGTSGSLLSVVMIKKFGNNYSFLITPPIFFLAGCAWFMVDKLGHERPGAVGGLSEVEQKKEGYGSALWHGAKAFGRSTYKGAFICFSSRRYIWLIPGYSFALYGHRYLENGIMPIIAKRVMLDSSYSQIMVTGSNAGELVGAATVLLITNYVQTPIPFLRFDALALLIVWAFPFYVTSIEPHQVVYAWKIAAMAIPISMGWAAGDVSLAAFIQASLARIESQDPEVSALGAVMAFLFSTYIIIYAVVGTLLGRVVDNSFKKYKSVIPVLKQVGGIQFTVLSIIIILATCIPKGAIAFNPKMISEVNLDEEAHDVDSLERDGSDDGKEPEFKKTDVGAML